MVKKGTWVEIKSTILEVGQRASTVPEDTAKTPLNMWVKGYLVNDAKLGELTTITTATGRIESGILEAVEPVTRLDFGQHIPEIAQISKQVRMEVSK